MVERRSPANFTCLALDLHLTSGQLYGVMARHCLYMLQLGIVLHLPLCAVCGL